MQAGGPVKWKDVKKVKAQKQDWKKNAMYLLLSLFITGAVFIVVILFHKFENKQIVKEIKTWKTNYKDGKPVSKYLKSIATYDTLGRLVKTIEFNALKSEIFESVNQYDPQGRLTDSFVSHNNPENDTLVTRVHFEYAGSHLSKKTFDSLHFVLYKYNSDNQLDREDEYKKTQGKNLFYKTHSVHYVYDKKAKLSQTDDSISPAKHKTTNYSYDADGNVNEEVGGKSTIVFSYYKPGRKSKELHKVDGKLMYKEEFDYEYYLRRY